MFRIVITDGKKKMLSPSPGQSVGLREAEEDSIFKPADKESLDKISQTFAELTGSRHRDWALLRSQMEPLTEDRGVMKKIIKIGTLS